MIKTNIAIIRQRGGVLNNALGDAMAFLDKYMEADEFATLSSEQTTTALVNWNALKETYLSAKTSFETAVNATEEIIEEEEEEEEI